MIAEQEATYSDRRRSYVRSVLQQFANWTYARGPSKQWWQTVRTLSPGLRCRPAPFVQDQRQAEVATLECFVRPASRPSELVEPVTVMSDAVVQAVLRVVVAVPHLATYAMSR